MRFEHSHEDRVAQAMREAFPTGLTAKQIMAVIRFAKLIRLRGRSNGALRNICVRLFRWCKAQFREVEAVARNGDKYMALTVEVPLVIDGVQQKPDKAIEETEEE